MDMICTRRKASPIPKHIKDKTVNHYVDADGRSFLYIVRLFTNDAYEHNRKHTFRKKTNC